MRVGARGKKSVRKLKQAKKSIHVDVAACLRWDQILPDAFRKPRPIAPLNEPSTYRPEPEFSPPRAPRGNAGCLLQTRSSRLGCNPPAKFRALVQRRIQFSSTSPVR